MGISTVGDEKYANIGFIPDACTRCTKFLVSRYPSVFEKLFNRKTFWWTSTIFEVFGKSKQHWPKQGFRSELILKTYLITYKSSKMAKSLLPIMRKLLVKWKRISKITQHKNRLAYMSFSYTSTYTRRHTFVKIF